MIEAKQALSGATRFEDTERRDFSPPHPEDKGARRSTQAKATKPKGQGASKGLPCPPSSHLAPSAHLIHRVRSFARLIV